MAIVQPKQIEVSEIQELLLSKEEYKQFRAISTTKTQGQHDQQMEQQQDQSTAQAPVERAAPAADAENLDMETQ